MERWVKDLFVYINCLLTIYIQCSSSSWIQNSPGCLYQNCSSLYCHCLTARIRIYHSHELNRDTVPKISEPLRTLQALAQNGTMVTMLDKSFSSSAMSSSCSCKSSRVFLSTWCFLRTSCGQSKTRQLVRSPR